jgi:hypothetical protein
MLAKLFDTLGRWLNPGPELKERAFKPLYQHEALTPGDPYYLSVKRLEQIDIRQLALRYLIAQAVKRKEKRSHFQSELEALQTERLQIERDLIKTGVIKPSFWQGA